MTQSLPIDSRHALNVHKFGWAPEAKQLLERLWGKGMSDSKVARAINEQFQCKLTRNAVIGQRHRMGLTTISKAGGLRRGVGRKPVGAVPRDKRPSEVANDQVKLVRRQEIKSALAVPFQCRPVAFAEREGCSWPIDQPEGAPFYCNETVLRRLSYCAYHFHAATNRKDEIRGRPTNGPAG